MSTRTIHRGATLGVLITGGFIGMMEQTAVVTALPIIGRAFPDSGLWLPWLISATLVGAALAMPLGGRMADTWGPKRTFTLGVGLFAVGSLVSGLTGLVLPAEIGLLLVARVVQGFGGGVFAPVAMKMASVLYQGKSRTQAIGLAGAVGPLAAIVGPLVGGYLADNFFWQAVLLVNVPPMLFVGLLALWLVPASPPSKGRGGDPLGMILLASTIMTVMLATTIASHAGGISLEALSAMLAAAFLGLLLVRTEQKHPAPLLDRRVLGRAGTSAIFPLAFVQGIVAYSTIYFISLYAQNHPTLRATGTQAGLVLVAGAVGQIIGAPLAGRYVPRFGYRNAVVIGTLLSALSLLALIAEPTSFGLLGALVLVSRGGSAFVRVPLAAAGLEASQEHAGLISGLRQLSDVVGGAVGPVAFGVLLGSTSFAPGRFGWVFASVGLLLLISLPLATRMPRAEQDISVQKPTAS